MVFEHGLARRLGVGGWLRVWYLLPGPKGIHEASGEARVEGREGNGAVEVDVDWLHITAREALVLPPAPVPRPHPRLDEGRHAVCEKV